VEIENIIERKSKLDLGKIEKIIIEKRVEIVTINDSNYPSLLKEISNPPYFFYLR
jgi:predicted Rossmann fold nucleotide-binding protein DprA/Smf involved in DNA uptake